MSLFLSVLERYTLSYYEINIVQYVTVSHQTIKITQIIYKII